MAGNRLSGKNPLIKGRGSSGNGPEWNRTSPRLAREPRLVLRSPPPPPPPPDAPSIRQMGEGEREGRGLRDSWRRFAISVSLMKASR